MKNSLFSIFLFIILLGFLTYTDISFKNLCSEVIDMCEEMETTMKSSSKEENFKNAMDIYDLMKQVNDAFNQRYCFSSKRKNSKRYGLTILDNYWW